MPAGTIYEAPQIKPGGLCDIIYTPWENVLAWPAVNPETGIIDDDITLKPGAILYTAETNNKTQSFTEETKDAIAGHFHDMIVNATLPGGVNNNTLTLSTMKYSRFLVIFKDKNGEYRFLGNEDSGAELNYLYTSGDNDTSRKRSLKFTWQHINAAPIYKGTLLNLNPTTSGGTIMLLARFKVGASGAPMIGGDTVYTNALLENKNVFVFRDREKDPELVTGITFEPYITKNYSGTTITWNNGSVNDEQIIEIYTY